MTLPWVTATNQSHFCPTSVKYLKTIIHARLSVFLSANNIVYDKQIGFRNQHSTNHTLIKIAEKIKQDCDFGEIFYGVILDFQKAFDTANHGIPLKKLVHFWKRDKSNKLLR